MGVPVANAGTPGPTESLGKSHGLEYLRAKYPNVVTHTAQPANCDGDSQIVGGGGSMAGPAPKSTLNETYPVEPSAWTAEGNTTAGARTLTAYAICAGFVPEYEHSQSPLDTNVVLFAGPSCGAGLDPIAGGGGATGSGIRTIASFPLLPPSTAGWRAAAHNTTMDDTLWDSYAICSGLNVKHRESARVKVRSEDSGRAIAKCKPKESVLSGGWAAKQGDVVGFLARSLTTRPWDSKDDRNKVPDDGWLVKAQNLHTGKVELVANATCKRPQL
jgi:hypothetical protein